MKWLHKFAYYYRRHVHLAFLLLQSQPKLGTRANSLVFTIEWFWYNKQNVLNVILRNENVGSQCPSMSLNAVKPAEEVKVNHTHQTVVIHLTSSNHNLKCTKCNDILSVPHTVCPTLVHNTPGRCGITLQKKWPHNDTWPSGRRPTDNGIRLRQSKVIGRRWRKMDFFAPGIQLSVAMLHCYVRVIPLLPPPAQVNPRVDVV